jgi:hypothetical protein
MKILEQLQKLAANPPRPFDPGSFNDPVALKAAWTPLRKGGSSFRTHKLVNVETWRIEFRASLGACLFHLFFLLIGLGALGLQVYAGEYHFILIIIGLVFASIGGSMLYFGTRPIVFDKSQGAFWRGRKPRDVGDPRPVKGYAPLQNIHALQIISEYCRGNKSSFYSHELNLVLEDGSRLNVIDHGNLRKLMQDAKALADFLGKPLWSPVP